MSRRKLTLDEIDKKIHDVHDNEVALVHASYVRSDVSCWFLDKYHGLWKTKLHHVLSGQVHPEHKRLSQLRPQTEVLDCIKKHHGNTVKLIGSFNGVHRTCLFEDSEYGQWRTTPSHIMRGQGHPVRGRDKTRISCNEFKKRLLLVHKNLVTLKDETYQRTDHKCTFIDADHGEWEARPSSILRGQGHPERARLKQAMSLEDFKSRLAQLSNGVRLNESTYVDATTKCQFVDDKFGTWEAFPTNILRGNEHPAHKSQKQKATFLKNYGVDHPLKHRVIQDKVARSTNKTTVEHHWKTNDELICVGSWELAVVRWLNANQVDYEWQPGPFMMPNGHTYRPDALITTGLFMNMYIEVKGYMRADAKVKWEWFHSEHPNSQLWTKKELQNIGILSKKRTTVTSNT